MNLQFGDCILLLNQSDISVILLIICKFKEFLLELGCRHVAHLFQTLRRLSKLRLVDYPVAIAVHGIKPGYYLVVQASHETEIL
jgi:DNA-binding LacI/PurR family transcriptional regulator